MGDARRQHARLAGAGAGQHQHRPVERLDRGALLGIEAVEVGRWGGRWGRHGAQGPRRVGYTRGRRVGRLGGLRSGMRRRVREIERRHVERRLVILVGAGDVHGMFSIRDHRHLYHAGCGGNRGRRKAHMRNYHPRLRGRKGTYSSVFTSFTVRPRAIEHQTPARQSARKDLYCHRGLRWLDELQEAPQSCARVRCRQRYFSNLVLTRSQIE